MHLPPQPCAKRRTHAISRHHSSTTSRPLIGAIVVLMSLLRIPFSAIVATTLLVSACATDAPKSASSAGEVAAAPSPSPTPSAATSSSDSATSAAAPATAAAELAPGDSITPKLAPGRGKMDATSFAAAIRAGTRKESTWPAGPAPAAGALLPKNRIIAYYGNPHSKKMGVIGEYPEQQMLGMLDRTVAAWKAADPKTPIIPAIHLVTVVAQGSPGADKMWRRRENA